MDCGLGAPASVAVNATDGGLTIRRPGEVTAESSAALLCDLGEEATALGAGRCSLGRIAVADASVPDAAVVA